MVAGEVQPGAGKNIIYLWSQVIRQDNADGISGGKCA